MVGHCPWKRSHDVRSFNGEWKWLRSGMVGFQAIQVHVSGGMAFGVECRIRSWTLYFKLAAFASAPWFVPPWHLAASGIVSCSDQDCHVFNSVNSELPSVR